MTSTLPRLADELADRFARRAETHDPASTFPHENYADLHASGWLRLVIPQAFGGQGIGLVEMVEAQHRLARGDGSTALVAAMSNALLGRLVESASWPAPVLSELCRRIANDGGTINTCVTEPELGSISRGGTPATTASPAAGAWRISGRKIFVTGAPAARFFVTAVVLPPRDGAPQGEVANAIIDATSPGLRLSDTWSGSLAMRTCGNFDVFYEDVLVPDAWMVDRRAIGTAGPRPGGDGWALVIAATYLGIGQAALAAACDYASERAPSALGRPIAEQPHIQQWLGQMRVALEAARAVLMDTARAWAAAPAVRDSLAAPIATAKYLCTNAACSATETALRVAGGFSLTRALPLERYFRDARAGLFQPPQDDLALMLIGRTAVAERRAERALPPFA